MGALRIPEDTAAFELCVCEAERAQEGERGESQVFACSPQAVLFQNNGKSTNSNQSTSHSCLPDDTAMQIFRRLLRGLDKDSSQQ